MTSAPNSAPPAAAVAEAAAIIAAARYERDTLPVAEAARLAWTPTGPSLAELERRIAARRTAAGCEVA